MMMAPTRQEIQDQQVFRVLLQAMSHPGRLYRLPEAVAIPDPLPCLLHCLADHEVSFCVAGDPVDRTVEALYSLTKCRKAPLEEADYVVVISPVSAPEAILQAKRGTPEYPDRGATVICLIEDQANENAPAPKLGGPGIHPESDCRPGFRGLDERVWRAMAEANAEYPLGVDGIFADRDANIMCVPRSTRITFTTPSAAGGT
jgi:alpha-D-ribose 1-methylphosphonate 5-triphosphate synthase subunit PhnH